MFFWNSLAFSMIQRMLDVWTLVHLPVLNPAWTSVSSWFTNCWGLENFEHYFASMRWVQLCGSLSILWHCLYLGLEWNWPFPVLFQCCGHCWVFQICWHIECSTFTASSFRIWNSSTGIPSPLLCFFIKPLDFTFQDVWLYVSDHTIVIIWVVEDLFCVVLLCILATSS